MAAAITCHWAELPVAHLYMIIRDTVVRGVQLALGCAFYSDCGLLSWVQRWCGPAFMHTGGRGIPHSHWICLMYTHRIYVASCQDATSLVQRMSVRSSGERWTHDVMKT